MANPTPVTVDDPHAVGHGGDGHHGEHMLLGHDGQLHPSRLQHHFVSAEQQFEASKLGMWLFLATEILLFGGMFVAYGIFRTQYPELYEQASLQLDTVLGAVNTLVLLLSSLTMAWAIRGAQMDNRKVLFWNLIATIALASGFLVVKYFEYTHKFHEGIYPGIAFELDEDVDTVYGLTGAVPLTPSYTPPRSRGVADGAVVESDAGEMVVVDEGLTGEDQNPAPVTPALPDVGEPAGGVQAEAETQSQESAVLAETPDATPPLGPDVAGELQAPNIPGVGVEPGVQGAPRGEEGLMGSAHGAEVEGRDKEAIYSNRRAGIFFSIYYMMTGIHALHILIGIVAIGILAWKARKGAYSSVWYTPVENVGLYWHVVDIIWIFVFPLMYLI
jgi:cytochrome c oxidase subunit 3